MYGYSELGCRCHTCGAYVPGPAPKTGNHLFCHNGGKCKMRHFRAFGGSKKPEVPVTPRSGPAGSQAQLDVGKSNAKDHGQLSDSLPAISRTAVKTSNARKARRKGKQ
jgi:hypothetical protein